MKTKNHSLKHIKNQKSTNHTSLIDIVKRALVVRFLAFFGALFVTQQDSFLMQESSSSQELTFVFPGTAKDWGIEKIDGVHGAASDWDFLFQDESENNVYIIPNGSDKLPESQDIPTEKDMFADESSDVWFPANVSGQLISGSIILPLLSQEPKTCNTPWGEYVAHQDFILAYEQRKDVDNLCNVQKRYCFNGKLTGSYSQKSCKENTVYSYIKPEAISYTAKPIDPFIQPGEPSLSGANFDTHGKINGTTQPIDVWGNDTTGNPVTSSAVSQTSSQYKRCTTAWGEYIPNGSFTKAYKSSIGLIDMPCDVEIRLCVDGKFKGSYTNRTCTFKKMTYRDYLLKNYDGEPTVGDLINTINTEETETMFSESSFWKWLDKYF